MALRGRPLTKRSPEELKGAELAAVLAGLRLLQEHLQHYGAPPASIFDVYHGSGRGLRPEEIERLCRRLHAR